MGKKDIPSPQLDAWQGDFGDAYIERNAPEPEIMEARRGMWRKILTPLSDDPPTSIFEVGANIGLNLRALGELTDARLMAIEPNASARKRLIADDVLAADDIYEGVAQSIDLPDGAADMVFTSGVLIHISPADLGAACTEIHRISNKYIACIEYFSDTPEEVRYRSQDGLLFKRDFGEFWLNSFPTLSLVDYGFFWKRTTGLDNLTWWVFRKNS